MPDIWTLLTERKRSAAGLPLVTYLDAALGERTELSATSVENAAAKIANALRDEFELDQGSTVGLVLPFHWQRTAWCAGAWTAGCIVVVGEGASDADLVVAGPAEAAGLSGRTAGEIAVVSLHPFGLPVAAALPPGCLDVTLVVRAQPDAYLHDQPVAGLAALGIDGSAPITQDEVIAFGRERAVRWGLEQGGRLLVDERAASRDAWLSALAVPLAAVASAVLVRGDYDAASVVAQERVTAFSEPRR